MYCAPRGAGYERNFSPEIKNKSGFFAIGLDFFAGTVIIIHVAIARLCKGSTTDSDSVCEGSNPSSAATENRLFFEKTVFLLPFRGFPVTAI